MKVKYKGGKGSGHFGHAGREGEVGGSLPGTGGIKPVTTQYKPIQPVDAGSQYISLSDTNQTGLVRIYEKRKEEYIAYRENIGNDTYAMDEWMKDTVITELSDMSGVEYDKVNAMIAQWAETANDNSPKSLFIQQRAAEMFETELSDWQKEKIRYREMMDQDTIENLLKSEYDQIYSNYYSQYGWAHRANVDPILSAMYENTQNMLAQAGYKPDDTITLYRGAVIDGLTTETGGNAKYEGNTIESWTQSLHTADTFAGDSFIDYQAVKGMKDPRAVVIAAKIPVKNIIGSYFSGFGCTDEEEFIVLGNIPGSSVRVIQNNPAPVVIGN